MPSLRSLTGPNPDPAPFPPQDLSSFLQCCEGSWMSLRSRFDLARDTDTAQQAGEEGAPPGDSWHQSERGELTMQHRIEGPDGEPGSLVSQAEGAAAQRLTFHADGSFEAGSDGRQPGSSGSWTLWHDGSLELSLRSQGRVIRERIWFTKPNLRLRSTVEQHEDGRAGRASFSSEIRRVSRPAAS